MLKKWRWKLYPNAPIVPHDQNIAVKEWEGDEYIISRKIDGFRDLKETLAEAEGKPIHISFVRMFGKKFINEINIPSGLKTPQGLNDI